jgi:hypothetical protein
MDILKRMQNVETGPEDRPKVEVKIVSATVQTQEEV